MNVLRTPLGKLLVAVVLLVVLACCFPSAQSGAITLSRWILGGLALAGLGLWLKTSQPVLGGAASTPLQVKARAGLGPRSGLVLVQAEGHLFLIAHGEGFVKMQPLSSGPQRSGRGAWVQTRPAPVKEVLQ